MRHKFVWSDQTRHRRGARPNFDGSLDGALRAAPEPEQQNIPLCNLIIICAGAAGDAKINGKDLRAQLAAQSSDEALALQRISETGLAAKDRERDFVLGLGLRRAAAVVDKNWNLIETLAKALLAGDGKMKAAEVVEVLKGAQSGAVQTD